MNLHVERYGKGQQCVFIHGAGGSGLSWYFQRELQRSMEVVLLDLPGHGQSSGPALDSIEGSRDSVYKTLQSMNITRCYIAGHSMGGAIAMSLALAYPDIVKGLILIGTGARLRVMPEILEGVLKEKENTLRMITETAFGTGASQTMKENGLKEMMKCEAETLYNDYIACDHFDAIGSVKDIKAPTLMLCGRSDLLTPPRYSEYLYRQIKGSDIGLVDGAGHMIMLEKPRELNTAIENFVRITGQTEL
ncbi:MAG: alpha/beta hydrolase [Syntrophus sp. (in: bacteria)]|nr:alpha/beta hydrolase [Syntrophus sp. (in: bacteria)]